MVKHNDGFFKEIIKEWIRAKHSNSEAKFKAYQESNHIKRGPRRWFTAEESTKASEDRSEYLDAISENRIHIQDPYSLEIDLMDIFQKKLLNKREKLINEGFYALGQDRHKKESAVSSEADNRMHKIINKELRSKNKKLKKKEFEETRRSQIECFKNERLSSLMNKITLELNSKIDELRDIDSVIRTITIAVLDHINTECHIDALVLKNSSELPLCYEKNPGVKIDQLIKLFEKALDSLHGILQIPDGKMPSTLLDVASELYLIKYRKADKLSPHDLSIIPYEVAISFFASEQTSTRAKAKKNFVDKFYDEHKDLLNKTALKNLFEHVLPTSTHQNDNY